METNSHFERYEIASSDAVCEMPRNDRSLERNLLVLTGEMSKGQNSQSLRKINPFARFFKK
jgi:hypothetical protein